MFMTLPTILGNLLQKLAPVPPLQSFRSPPVPAKKRTGKKSRISSSAVVPDDSDDDDVPEVPAPKRKRKMAYVEESNEDFNVIEPPINKKTRVAGDDNGNRNDSDEDDVIEVPKPLFADNGDKGKGKQKEGAVDRPRPVRAKPGQVVKSIRDKYLHSPSPPPVPQSGVKHGASSDAQVPTDTADDEKDRVDNAMGHTAEDERGSVNAGMDHNAVNRGDSIIGEGNPGRRTGLANMAGPTVNVTANAAANVATSSGSLHPPPAFPGLSASPVPAAFPNSAPSLLLDAPANLGSLHPPPAFPGPTSFPSPAAFPNPPSLLLGQSTPLAPMSSVPHGAVMHPGLAMPPTGMPLLAPGSYPAPNAYAPAPGTEPYPFAATGGYPPPEAFMALMRMMYAGAGPSLHGQQPQLQPQAYPPYWPHAPQAHPAPQNGLPPPPPPPT